VLDGWELIVRLGSDRAGPGCQLTGLGARGPQRPPAGPSDPFHARTVRPPPRTTRCWKKKGG